jgi:hypothetical protein
MPGSLSDSGSYGLDAFGSWVKQGDQKVRTQGAGFWAVGSAYKPKAQGQEIFEGVLSSS